MSKCRNKIFLWVSLVPSRYRKLRNLWNFHRKNKLRVDVFSWKQIFYFVVSRLPKLLPHTFGSFKNHKCKNLTKYHLSHHVSIMIKETQTSVILPSHETLLRTVHGHLERDLYRKCSFAGNVHFGVLDLKY